MKKIFLYGIKTNRGYLSFAVDRIEDGELYATVCHLSSAARFVKHDIKNNHDIYKEKYPDGYSLEWVGVAEDKEHELEIIKKIKKGLQ